ncbi:Protein Y43F4A.1 a, partial [Aphelenchoides avenae]
MLQAVGSPRENHEPTQTTVNRPWLIFLLLALVAFTTGHQQCSYEVPREEDLILNVPLSRSDKRGRFTRDVTRNRDYKSLRIFLYFDPESIDPLPVSKQVFINSSLLPQAIGFWEQALLVRRSNAPIRLSRKCKSNHFYLETSESHPSCVDKCRDVTTCGEVSVPDEHLYKCRYCALPNPLTCTSSGPPDGPGVSGADFLLYVSAVNSERCKNQDTIAYAAHCQQEAELDRPIAGHVNICPTALSTHSHDQEILLSTVKHEILHALGFSAGLYAFFRDSEGRPRTKRNRYNRPISFNRERGYYDPDETTVKTVVRDDWWTAEGLVSHPVHVMVTERVREEARKHFACDDLEGAELENQGGDGTALTHWEKRLFENEAMTGTHTQNPVYSRLTLALMEDSGWYKSNYSVAEPLHWGHKLGCDFAMKSCGDWIRQRMA